MRKYKGIYDYETTREKRLQKLELPDNPSRTLKRGKRGLNLGKNKNISSFDLEVYTSPKGFTTPVMLGFSELNTNGDIINRGIIDRDIKTKKPFWEVDRLQIFKNFVREMKKFKYANNLNFFYNIRYDMSVLISLLPESKREDLYWTDRTEIDDIKIFIIPKKFMVIERDRYKIPFYDLASFTRSSLDKASKEWIGKGKMKTSFDIGEVMNDFEKMKKHYESGELQKYCVIDTDRTCELGFEIRKKYNKKDIPFSKPISPASITKDYIKYNQKIDYPRYTNYTLQNLSYKGFYGGLFEFYQRGYFENAKGYDVDSLYPYVMKDLPNLAKSKVFEGDIVLKDADFGVYLAKVELSDDCYISPFPVKAKVSYMEGRYKKMQEKIIRPILKGQEVVITKETYDFLTSEHYPYLESIKIKRGFNIFENNENNRPFKYIENLFDERVKLLKNDKMKEQAVLKIILNSGYGITAETIDKQKYKKIDGRIFTGEKYLKAGVYFRPFYAFYITDLARLMMYKNIYKAGIEQEVIGVATDCIYITEKGQEKFEKFANVNKKKELGSFSVDYKGDMIAIGNGVYQFRDNETGEVKIKCRGFNEKRVPNFFETEKYDNLDKLKIKNIRPLSFREVVHFFSNEGEKIGNFIEEKKELNINMDLSRNWEGNFQNIADVKNKRMKSKPLKLPTD